MKPIRSFSQNTTQYKNFILLNPSIAEFTSLSTEKRSRSTQRKEYPIIQKRSSNQKSKIRKSQENLYKEQKSQDSLADCQSTPSNLSSQSGDNTAIVLSWELNQSVSKILPKKQKLLIQPKRSSNFEQENADILLIQEENKALVGICQEKREQLIQKTKQEMKASDLLEQMLEEVKKEKAKKEKEEFQLGVKLKELHELRMVTQNYVAYSLMKQFLCQKCFPNMRKLIKQASLETKISKKLLLDQKPCCGLF